jgi:single-stranded DNA-binding protein
VFGRLADVVQNLVTKGSQLYVEGEFNVNNYTDDSGNKKSFTCINVTSFQVLGNFKERGGSNEYRDDDGDVPYDEADGDMPF